MSVEIGDMLHVFAKPRVKSYSENEALKQAQQRYYQKNKEEKLKHNKEYYKTWLASQDIDELKAKQRESRIKYYNKKKQSKQPMSAVLRNTSVNRSTSSGL